MPDHAHVTVQIGPYKPRLDCGGNSYKEGGTLKREEDKKRKYKIKKLKDHNPGRAMPDLNSLPPSNRSPPPPSSSSSAAAARPISAQRSLSPAPLPTSSSSSTSPRLPVLGGMSSASNDTGEPAASPTQPSLSPSRSASTSLQAAAAVNAGLQRGSRRALAVLFRFVLLAVYCVLRVLMAC